MQPWLKNAFLKIDNFLNSFKAHCCEDNSLNSIRINIGDHLWQEGDEDSYMEIQKIIIHPEYRSSYNGIPYDFCMIQTKEKMVIDGDKTQVACFPEAGVHADGNEAECWTAGWGQVSFGSIEDPLQLQTLKVNLYDDETCFNHALNWQYYRKSDSSPIKDRHHEFSHYSYYYPDYYYYDDNYDYGDYYDNNSSDINSTNHYFYNPEVEFCAGHYDVTNDTYTAQASSCYGDSGGPLGRDGQKKKCMPINPYL